jgi:nucleoside-triphosphatase
MEGGLRRSSHPEPHVLLLTGVPGVGKTTVIRKAAEHLKGKRLGGFYTEEIREKGERRGFHLAGFAGEEGTIAHVAFRRDRSVGKYGVDVGAIDALSESALSLDRGAQVFLVDEIGKMECISARFVSAMRALLDSGKPVVATISRKGGRFIEAVKARPDVLEWEVTRGNRDALPERIVEWLIWTES